MIKVCVLFRSSDRYTGDLVLADGAADGQPAGQARRRGARFELRLPLADADAPRATYVVGAHWQ